ncbi:MAG: CDP-diacylglycerol--serine O-phosphatidyltransferase [bacterium]
MSEFDDSGMDEMDREILADDELEERRSRGIRFLPSAITTAAMFAGFYAIISALSGEYFIACIAIVVAAVADSLDGRVARLTKMTSPFGQEYDSLSDLISFGMAPAIVTYFWAFESVFTRLGWAVAFIYLACSAIRLAKFNTLTGEEESKKYFRGLPSPGAALLIASQVLVYSRYAGEGGLPLEPLVLQGLMLVWLFVLSLLMVSNIRFRTFKDLDYKKYGPVVPLVFVAGGLAVFMVRPQETLFVGVHLYLVWGLVEGGIIMKARERQLWERRRQARKQRRLKRKLEKKRSKARNKESKSGRRSPFRSVK